ncbi:MAG: DNA primase [Chloroflexi bacterium]|uniref:DNA primase n=1 Tax=Candidatus Chlorohelix allophototropha TaxID=3003348 RepID=A0A8T7M1I2_9CHLR|nr:DNA primase [Chloroflexota bacterium]WJW66475.1 DNA primase [Chloroflexota bacterium L227-S17]
MNGFVPNYIEEIKRRLSVVDHISARVPLKKSGKNYKGLCPFHGEKSGSFFVFPQTESYYCFGCHESGDVFTFTMKTEGLEFNEALEMLAKRAGVDLPEREPQIAPDPEIQSQQQLKERLKEINAAAAIYFSHLLLKSNEGQAARDYLAKREVTPKAVELFGLGYALDSWDNLFKHLTAKGRFSPQELVQAGLVGERENGDGYYDRFRGRLIFPIKDRQGQIIAFGGRVLEGAPSDAPKYLNSPQTFLFDKSATLYGFDLARDSIRHSDCAVVVEGYMDVIAAHEAGFSNVVAPLGTALTEKHVVSLKKLTKRIVLALDADYAGQKATLQGIEVLKRGFDSYSVAVPNPKGLIQFEQQLDADIRVAILPTGKDPDEVVRESPDRWKEMIARAVPVVDYTFTSVAASMDLNNARGKSEAVEILIPVILEVRDRIEREHYIQKLARITNTGADLLYAELKRVSRAQYSKPSAEKSRNDNTVSGVDIDTSEETPPRVIQIGARRQLDYEDKLLAFVWRYSKALDNTGQEDKQVSSDDFRKGENRFLYESLIEAKQHGVSLTEVEESFTPEMASYFAQLMEDVNAQPELDPYGEVSLAFQFQLRRLRNSRAMDFVPTLVEMQRNCEELANTGENADGANENMLENEDEIFRQADQLRVEIFNNQPSLSVIFKDSRDR